MYMLECQLIKGEIHLLATTILIMGFPSGSDSKESICNAGDLGSILGSGRSPGEGKGYSLQCSGLEDSMDCIDSSYTLFFFVSFAFKEQNV